MLTGTQPYSRGVLLFFCQCILLVLLYPARARVPLGASGAKVDYEIVSPMVASLFLGGFGGSWVDFWCSST